jgi:hypothetical protein
MEQVGEFPVLIIDSQIAIRRNADGRNRVSTYRLRASG